MPRIGLSPCRNMTDYLESVRRAGGEGVELALTGSLPDLLRELDGVLLTGGGDVDPRLYGEAAHVTYGKAEPGRDLFEIELVRGAAGASVPMFGICRGMQVVNVALGGTLVQDLPSMVPGALTHDVPEPRAALAHDVMVAGDSTLRESLGHMDDGATMVQVNSRHHQAVGVLAGGWKATAVAADGVIEAMEWPGHAFALAVQWHPENFWRTGEFDTLFQAFVRAATIARRPLRTP